jgi:hypothetical protein
MGGSEKQKRLEAYKKAVKHAVKSQEEMQMLFQSGFGVGVRDILTADEERLSFDSFRVCMENSLQGCQKIVRDWKTLMTNITDFNCEMSNYDKEFKAKEFFLGFSLENDIAKQIFREKVGDLAKKINTLSQMVESLNANSKNLQITTLPELQRQHDQMNEKLGDKKKEIEEKITKLSQEDKKWMSGQIAGGTGVVVGGILTICGFSLQIRHAIPVAGVLIVVLSFGIIAICKFAMKNSEEIRIEEVKYKDISGFIDDIQSFLDNQMTMLKLLEGELIEYQTKIQSSISSQDKFKSGDRKIARADWKAYMERWNDLMEYAEIFQEI